MVLEMIDEYNVGIITTIFRKSIVDDFGHIFDEKFSIMGDLPVRAQKFTFLKFVPVYYIYQQVG